jgi:two-component system sensor histidine kinase KdpD
MLRLRGYVAAIAAVVVAMAAALVLQRLPNIDLSLLFLLAVLIVAAVWGLWPSIFASLAGFLTLNFFFTTPLYTLTVEEEGDLVNLFFFLAMAALTGNLAARMRKETAASRMALNRVSTLLAFSRQMGSAVTAQQALSALAEALQRLYEAPVAAWLREEASGLRLTADCPGEPGVELFDMSRIDALSREEKALPTSDTDRIYLRLAAGGRRVGLVAIAAAAAGAEQKALTDGLCELASIAMERTALVNDLKEAQLISETEQMRSALLSSVSHDLKTPLASIVGSVSSVLEYSDRLKPEDQRELLRTVLDESQRLNRYIQNLLDMTRFGRDRIELRREWVDMNDLISAAIERLGSALDHVDLRIEVAQEGSLIQVHGALVEQALVNVLDNAADFSDPGATVLVRSYSGGDASIIEVVDEGPGIPDQDRAKVFDMFYSAQQGDRRRYGVGLGLAICRSIVRAHGGSMAALAGANGRGTCMRITLPSSENPVGEARA